MQHKPKDGIMITAVPDMNIDESDEEMQISKQNNDEEESTNKIFNVREAVPPTDYDAPYS